MDNMFNENFANLEERINIIRESENLKPIKIEKEDVASAVLYLACKDFSFFLNPFSITPLSTCFDFNPESKIYKCNFLKIILYNYSLLLETITDSFDKNADEQLKEGFATFLKLHKELLVGDNFQPLREFFKKSSYKEFLNFIKNLSRLETRKEVLQTICKIPDGVDAEKLLECLVYLDDSTKTIYQDLLNLPFIKFKDEELGKNKHSKDWYWRFITNSKELVLDYKMIDDIKNVFELSKKYPEIITMTKSEVLNCYPNCSEETFLAFKKILKEFAKAKNQLYESNNKFLH